MDENRSGDTLRESRAAVLSPKPGPKSAKKSRPTWLIVLSILAAISGCQSLLHGAGAFLYSERPPSRMVREMSESAKKPESRARIAIAMEQITQQFSGRTLTMGAAQAITGATMLFAAVTALMLHRFGRDAFTIAAVANIISALVEVGVMVPMSRAITLGMIDAMSAEPNARHFEQLSGIMMGTMRTGIYAGAAVTVVFSMILLSYFGGRKGQLLFGPAG